MGEGKAAKGDYSKYRKPPPGIEHSGTPRPGAPLVGQKVTVSPGPGRESRGRAGRRGGLPVSALGLEGVGSGVGGARREVAGGPGGGVGRGTAAFGVDSARRGAGGGGGSGEEVGGGPRGPWGGARRRPRAAAAAAVASGCFRARHAPARAPARRAGGSRGRAGAWPRSARRRFALPSPPRPAPWQLPRLSLAETSAACAPKSCGLRVGLHLGIFFILFWGEHRP